MQRSYHFAMAERSRLSARDLAQLLACAPVQHFSSGQFIQHQGDPGDAFWAVVGGHVTIGRHSEDGVFTHFGVVGAGDLFGELAFFTGVPRQVDAIADGNTSLIAINRTVLRQLMAADVGWAELLLRSLSRQLASALDMIDAERRLSTVERLAGLLVTMARESPGCDTVYATQQQLADMLGVSRVSLGTALRKLAKREQIEPRYRQIRLLGSLADQAVQSVLQ
jgi:CRP/FNR family transcriptional regulator, cyclic AMP receptor protein